MYENYFERNYGVFTAEEQTRIRKSKIVIVGNGGIGGLVAVILARSGIENFVLYDFDEYSISNLNRQIGCFQDTIGRKKAEVIKEQILAINPQANVISPSQELSVSKKWIKLSWKAMSFYRQRMNGR